MPELRDLALLPVYRVGSRPCNRPSGRYQISMMDDPSLPLLDAHRLVLLLPWEHGDLLPARKIPRRSRLSSRWRTFRTLLNPQLPA